MTVVLYDRSIDSTVDHSPTRQFEKDCPVASRQLAPSRKILTEFPLCNRILQDAHLVGVYLPLASFRISVL